jgi:hypothetical protein
MGTAGVSDVLLTNSPLTMTGDTGVSITRPIWLAGFEGSLNLSTSSYAVNVLEVGFSSTYGPTWAARVTANTDDPMFIAGPGYTLTYYTE